MNWENLKELLLTLLGSLVLRRKELSARTATPSITRDISNWELRRILEKTFPGIPIYLSEVTFSLCSLSDVATFLAIDATNRYEYEGERVLGESQKKPHYDCDDFTFRLIGEFSIPGWADKSLGFVWTELHALAILVDEDERVWFVEPQTDDIQSELKSWQGSKPVFVIM